MQDKEQKPLDPELIRAAVLAGAVPDTPFWDEVAEQLAELRPETTQETI